MEAVAQYDYIARNNDELSFNTGNVLKILNEGDKEWYNAELLGKVGLIPYNYVAYEPPSWYVDASKEQVVNMLKRSDNSNIFYVRPSQTSQNEMSLSVVIRDGMQNFRILRSGTLYYLWNDGPKFDSVNKMVEYYENHSVCAGDNVFLKSKTQRRVIAEYDFESRSSEEMSIYKGDVITFIEKVDQDWSKGSITRKGKHLEGLYPASYVREE